MSDVCVHSKRGRANNVVCSKSDASVAGCSLTSEYADIVRRNVVGQKKMNIKACVPIRRKDDNWNAQFTAQQLQNKDLMTTESKPSSFKAKQTFLDLTSPSNRTAFGELKNVESKTPDFPIANFIYRTDCRSMLLIRRVSQLWLTYALNSVNSIRAAIIKHWINGVGF